MAAGAWHRSPGHPPDERRRVARASPGEDRPTRYRVAQASLSRLAARRTGSLQHGRDPHARRGGCQAAKPRARGLGRRAHPHCQPDEKHPGSSRHSRLQADLTPAPERLAGLLTAEVRHRRRTPWPSCAAIWRGWALLSARSGRSRRRLERLERHPARRPRDGPAAGASSALVSRPRTCWCMNLSRNLRDRRAVARYAG